MSVTDIGLWCDETEVAEFFRKSLLPLRDRVAVRTLTESIRRNSLSIAISAIALGSYVAWVSADDSTSLQTFYDRYIAEEESRPRIFDEGIAVRLNREAPPVAALEEALRDQPWTSIERSPSTAVRPTSLRADAASAENMAVRILAENERARIEIQFALRAAEQRRQIDTILTTPIAPPVNLPSRSRTQDPVAGRGGASFVGAQVADARKSGRVLEKIQIALPMAHQTAEPQAVAQKATPKTISLSKTGVTREQLLAALFMPIAENGKSANTSGQIFRSAGQTDRPASRTLFAPDSRKPFTAGNTSKVEGPRAFSAEDAREIANRSHASRGEAPMSIASGSTNGIAPAGRQIMIRGPIELADGLALTHARDRIAVVRESRGRFVESGAVWIREARYEIFVESLEGHLVAEVRSPQGDVVGRGQIELASVTSNPDLKNVDGVKLRVLPVTTGISGRAQSAYSSSAGGSPTTAGSTSRGVLGARVNFNQTPEATKTVGGGHFEESKFTEGSRVVATIKAKDHWPTVAMLTAGQESNVPVFSNKMMNAFVGLTSKDSRAAETLIKTRGVIWGRVTRSMSSVAGARVEVITEGTGAPVYFNDMMLPDETMTATGANGIFAIPAVEKGLHGIQVYLGKRLSDPVFIQSDVGSVASVDLDVLRASEIQARAFDAFRTDLPVAAELRPMGHIKARHMLVNGEAGRAIKLAHLGLPAILDVTGGDEYLAVRTIQNPDARHLHIPMVQRAWFDRIVGRVRFNNEPGTGNVIGFVQGNRFRVSIDQESISAGAKIIYFDERGEMTSKEYGQPGGGFILLGVKDGLQTIIVEAEQSNRILAATVLVQEGVVASLSHWLR